MKKKQTPMKLSLTRRRGTAYLRTYELNARCDATCERPTDDDAIAATVVAQKEAMLCVLRHGVLSRACDKVLVVVRTCGVCIVGVEPAVLLKRGDELPDDVHECTTRMTKGRGESVWVRVGEP